MAKINAASLTRDLNALGVRTGDTVMMHSSLSALGPVEGGAETVVDALRAAIGSEGTVVVPAFRDSVWGDPANFCITEGCPCPQRLCSSRQPGFQGVIAEAVRNRPGSLRSCHRTHSWAALGPRAEQILGSHRDSVTFCGPHSPFEEVLKLDGCILALGVQVNTVTYWHYYEELLRVPYLGHYWPREKHMNHCVPGRRIYYEFPGIMQDVCRTAGILNTGPVGKSTSGMMRAREFESFQATVMADDPYCFVLRPPDRQSADLAVDALQKAAAMLRAWRRGPRRPEKAFNIPPQPICPAGPNDLVRRDCPAFAGMHEAHGKAIPLCRANGRHPDYFRLGGIFNQCGITTCDRCSWPLKFPEEHRG
jgi:aminoglycoside 3-N-acetyltransferase